MSTTRPAASIPLAHTKDGTLRNRTDRTRPASTVAHVSSRPEGTSTTTRVSPSRIGIRPSSSAHVTSAIVPCPQAVE